MHANTKTAIYNSIVRAVAKNPDANGVVEVIASSTNGVIRIVPIKRSGIPTVKLEIKVGHFSVYLYWPKQVLQTPAVMSVRSIEDVKVFNKWYAAMMKLAAHSKRDKTNFYKPSKAAREAIVRIGAKKS